MAPREGIKTLPKGLIVHEWIEKAGGSERVVDEMVSAFPESDIFCLWSDAPGRYPNQHVSESLLSRTPLRKHKALAIPAMLSTWRSLNPSSAYDWMLVSSHLFAHHARIPSQRIPKHVYVHTPARYVWNPELDARGAAWPFRLASKYLKPLDRSRAREANSLIANSNFVRARIEHSWELESTVLYPPVRVRELQSEPNWETRVQPEEARILDALPNDFVLGASRFVPYKRLDAVIDAASAAGLPVVIAGSGPQEGRLKALAANASVPVTFVISPSDAMLNVLFARALVYMFPPVEDFGIMPIEAMAMGTPVVANVVGGAAESVSSGVTGFLSNPDSARESADALSRAASLSSEDCKQAAQRFDTSVFHAGLRSIVGEG